MAVLAWPVEDCEQIHIENLVASIERRRDQLELATPWSIAELRLDEEDYVWLGRWAASLESQTVQEWSRTHWIYANSPVSPGRPRQACLGLLLLALAAEAARREATERTLWRYVRHTSNQKLRFGGADSQLFLQDQPSRIFKAALRAAVETFGLRHATDDIETNVLPYYRTIFLQFGFSIRDAVHRLPAWLAGQSLQVAMEDLATRGGRLGSESFAGLWRDMRHCRSGLLPTETLRKRLGKSPWVLQAWRDTLLSLIGQARPSSSAGGDDGTRGGLDTLLDPPRLVWPGGGAPHFECRIAGLATATLPGREYTMRISGRVVARIERGESGLESDRDAVSISGFPPVFAVELRDEESGASESLSCECFDPREPALLFDLRSGRRLEACGRPGAAGRYALVFANDLTLRPEPDEWRAFRCGLMTLRVAAMAANVSGARLLTREGAVVWEARTGSYGSIAPPWARVKLNVVGKSATPLSVPIGEPYDVAILHRADVRVTFVRRGMEPLEPKPIRPGLTHVGPISTTVPSLGTHSKWLIGLEHEGKSARVAHGFEPTRHGGAIFRGDAWEVLDPQNALAADDLRRLPVLMIPPPVWGDRKICEGREVWAVMEGEDWVDVPRSRPGVVKRLSGLGAPLTVRLGPFNAVPATPPEGGPQRIDAMILADRVLDQGLVRGLVRNSEYSCSWRIELADKMEIDERYEVHWWDQSGGIHHLRPSAWAIDGSNWWSIEPPAVASEPRALFVTYGDRRLGAWWAPDWALGLAEVAAVRDPRLIADLIRWAKLPMLEARSLPEARRLAEQWPVEVLGSWLSEDAPDGWRFVVRAAFRDWRPEADQVEGLSTAWGHPTGIPEVATARRLMEICPILMGRFLRAKATVASPEEMRAVYRRIREIIEADLRFEVCDCDFVGSEDDVRDGIQRVTGLDTAFLKTLNAVGAAAVFDLPAAGDFDQRPNLDLAVSRFTACRLLLALDVLESLEAGEPTHWKGGPCGSPRRLEADRLVAAQARRFHRG